MAELGRQRGEQLIAERARWEGDCLIWGKGNPEAYGTLRIDGRQELAHRFAWMVAHGEIPEGAKVDHRCHNPRCVNILHLRLATNRENTRHKRGANKNNKLGVRNVHLRRSGRFQVAVRGPDGKQHGTTHDTIEEAEREAAELRSAIYGEFAGAA